MRTEINIPRVNTNENDVEIVHWYVEDRSHIEAGADLVDIGTSKATMTLQAEKSGYVTRLGEKGQMKPVGSVIARISETQEALVEEPSIKELEIESFSEARFSEPARKYLKEHSIDESRFKNQGLVTVEVIRQGLGLSVPKPMAITPVKIEPVPYATEVGIRREPVLRSKKIEIANLQRGQEGGVNSTLSVYLHSQAIRRKFEQEKIFGGALLPIIVFEVARLLKEQPRLNSFYESEQLNYYDHINIGIALDIGKGLKVVVLKGTDRLWPNGIYERLTDFGRKDLENQLGQEDLEGSTFTISDLSAANILNFVPLINGRQAAILGIGGDSSLPGSPITLTVTFDHRVVTGREVADFLSRLRERVLSYGTNAGKSGAPTAGNICCDFCLIDLESYYKKFGSSAMLLNYVRPDGATGHVCHVCSQGY